MTNHTKNTKRPNDTQKDSLVRALYYYCYVQLRAAFRCALFSLLVSLTHFAEAIRVVQVNIHTCSHTHAGDEEEEEEEDAQIIF